MDYVIFGIGMGASLVLFGLAGRTIGPSLRYRRSRETGDVLKAEELVARIAWARFCGSLGAAIALGGLLLLIVTGLSMAMRISDGAAGISVGLALVAVIVLMIFWTWAFVDRFGLYGIVAERKVVATSSLSSSTEDDTEVVPPMAKLDDTADEVDQPQKRRWKILSRRQENPPQPAPLQSAIGPEPQPPAETVPPVSAIDASRSEVVNPSDAAALERILTSPEPDPSVVGTGETATESEPETASIDPAVDGAEENEPDEQQSDASVQATEDPGPAAPWNRRKQLRR